MTDRRSPRLFLTPGALKAVPEGPLQRLAGELTHGRARVRSEHDMVVATAGDLLGSEGEVLPDWADAEARYLVISDVPEAALMRLPEVLGMHKPHLRLHTSRDPGVVTRLLIAQTRGEAWEGIVDAYVLGTSLVTVLGDLTIRAFPVARLPRLEKARSTELASFELDSSGSYLYWASKDLHLGASQLLQAVDPTYLTDVEIQRYAMDKVSLALLDMRQSRSLNQGDIPGLSERQVRRLEREESRLTVDAAEKLAAAFGLSLGEFLSELSERVTGLGDAGNDRELAGWAVQDGGDP